MIEVRTFRREEDEELMVVLYAGNPDTTVVLTVKEARALISQMRKVTTLQQKAKAK